MDNQSSQIPTNVEQRDLSATDSGPEERFEQLTRLARALFSVSNAVISIVDPQKRDFRYSKDLNPRETSHAQPLLDQVLRSKQTLLIEDAEMESRAEDSSRPIQSERIRFYAGVPILASDNQIIGVFSIFDQNARSFKKEEITLLEALARKAESAFNPQSSTDSELTPRSRFIDNFFEIRKLHSLRMLEDGELMLLLRVAKIQTFPPGFQIAEISKPMNRLYLLVEGNFDNGVGMDLHPVVGAVSLLLNELPAYPIYAGPKGVKCIVLLKAQYFTLINECPRLIHSLIETLSFGNK